MEFVDETYDVIHKIVHVKNFAIWLFSRSMRMDVHVHVHSQLYGRGNHTSERGLDSFLSTLGCLFFQQGQRSCIHETFFYCGADLSLYTTVRAVLQKCALSFCYAWAIITCYTCTCTYTSSLHFMHVYTCTMISVITSGNLNLHTPCLVDSESNQNIILCISKMNFI